MKNNIYGVLCKNLKWKLEEKVRGEIVVKYFEKDDTLYVKIRQGDTWFKKTYDDLSYRLINGFSTESCANAIIAGYTKLVVEKTMNLYFKGYGTQA